MTAIYECAIAHTRTTPLRNEFHYGGYLWLVDLDDLPRIRRPFGPLARFRAQDHLGGAAGSLRAAIDGYLAGQGVHLRGGRVLMLTSARVLGYVFNPLTVYWCFEHPLQGQNDNPTEDGASSPPGGPRLACVVAEVHNTYGERHCYLVRTDDRGRAQADKAFYVSPFEPADGGYYQLSLPVPGEHLDLTITLHRPGAAPFVAAVRGSRLAPSTRSLLRMVRRHPVAPLVAALRIRRQGIGLWLRGLPVVPRPAPEPTPATPEKREVVR